jgi:hypothetical protein
VSQDQNRSSLSVPPSIQDYRQGLLDATVMLVMYGDYQSSQSADVYRLIKVIQHPLNGSLGENYLSFIFRHFPQRTRQTPLTRYNTQNPAYLSI